MQEVSRRRFLALGGGFVAFALAACKKKPAASLSPGGGENPTTTLPGGGPTTAYRLDPDYSSDPAACPGGPGSCLGCHACQQHAANRIFPSSTPVRAHTGCRCLVVVDPSISATTYTALFTNPNNPTGGPVDRRWSWVAPLVGA